MSNMGRNIYNRRYYNPSQIYQQQKLQPLQQRSSVDRSTQTNINFNQRSHLRQRSQQQLRPLPRQPQLRQTQYRSEQPQRQYFGGRSQYQGYGQPFSPRVFPVRRTDVRLVVHFSLRLTSLTLCI